MELCHRGLFPRIPSIPGAVTSPAHNGSVLAELGRAAPGSVWQPWAVGNAELRSPTHTSQPQFDRHPCSEAKPPLLKAQRGEGTAGKPTKESKTLWKFTSHHVFFITFPTTFKPGHAHTGVAFNLNIT